jgi:hypothetical protein
MGGQLHAQFSLTPENYPPPPPRKPFDTGLDASRFIKNNTHKEEAFVSVQPRYELFLPLDDNIFSHKNAIKYNRGLASGMAIPVECRLRRIT